MLSNKQNLCISEYFTLFPLLLMVGKMFFLPLFCELRTVGLALAKDVAYRKVGTWNMIVQLWIAFQTSPITMRGEFPSYLPFSQSSLQDEYTRSRPEHNPQWRSKSHWSWSRLAEPAQLKLQSFASDSKEL